MGGTFTAERQSDQCAAARAPSAALSMIGRTTSRVGLGTGGLLRIGSARRRRQVLAAALGAGVTHFDTAPIYGFGESERALGSFLQQQRHRVTLTTKFGLRTSRLAAKLAPLQRVGRAALRYLPALRAAAVRNSNVLYAPPDFSADAVRASLDASLRALRTDYIDFFLAHQASATALPSLEVIELLEQMRRAGKILAFGVATEFDWMTPVLCKRPELSRVVQFDSELTTAHVATFRGGPEQLLITYGFIGRAVALCRERMRCQPANDLGCLEDHELGGLLLRAAVLANPHGIVLMQSRSVDRIVGNAQAAFSDHRDDLAHRVVALLRSNP